MDFLKAKEKGIFFIIKAVLSHFAMAPFLLLFGVVCWFFGYTEFLILFYVLIFTLILLFCEDLKNLFPMVLYVSYFLEDINWGAPVEVYAMAIGVAIVALISFLVKNIITKRSKLKKGDMFVGLIFAIVAFSIGGIGRFNLTYFLITLGLFASTYVLYFIARNFTVDFKNYLPNLFVCGAFIVTVQLAIGNYRLGFFSGVDKHVVYLGAQNVNVVSEMFFFGTVSAIYLGIGKKRDWAYLLFSLTPLLGIYMTYCRTTYAIAIVFTVALTILMVIKSPNKRAFIIGLSVFVLLLILAFIAFYNKIIEELAPMLDKFGDNGRLQHLWPWCWARFKEYPYFGFGFVADEHIPNTYAKYYVVLAHNTPLQWLTSLGVVGSSILTYFYLEKYRIVFRKMTIKKFVYASVIFSLACAGIFDQAPTMDFFMFLTPLIVIASFEDEESDKPKLLY